MCYNIIWSCFKLQQEGADNLQDKIAAELIDKEQRILKLQRIIEEQRENEKLMFVLFLFKLLSGNFGSAVSSTGW